ncbi:MAG: hypothetical protein IPK00_24445 [Deltaproteobacteria bacterium]|nr:hypothetical protein [Deltaproteobacteria bacterium]
MTPIEAMACGLPVVACAESAVPEVCGDGADHCEREATGVPWLSSSNDSCRIPRTGRTSSDADSSAAAASRGPSWLSVTPGSSSPCSASRRPKRAMRCRIGDSDSRPDRDIDDPWRGHTVGRAFCSPERPARYP